VVAVGPLRVLDGGCSHLDRVVADNETRGSSSEDEVDELELLSTAVYLVGDLGQHDPGSIHSRLVSKSVDKRRT
jgi:hypothetical protein